MLRERIILLLMFLVLSAASATEIAEDDAPPTCSETSQTDDDDAAPCIPAVEWQQTDGEESTATSLSLDESEDDAIDTTSLDGTSTIHRVTVTVIMAATWKGQAIIFSSCGFFLLSFYRRFFPFLISMVADWMSTILKHMVWR